MRRRPLIVLVVMVALVVIAVPALSAATRTGHAATAKVTVKPVVGAQHTRFVVTFVTPRQVGPAGAFATRYAATAIASRASMSGPGARAGIICAPPRRITGRWTTSFLTAPS
jgi:hypothetical protein